MPNKALIKSRCRLDKSTVKSHVRRSKSNVIQVRQHSRSSRIKSRASKLHPKYQTANWQRGYVEKYLEKKDGYSPSSHERAEKMRELFLKRTGYNLSEVNPRAFIQKHQIGALQKYKELAKIVKEGESPANKKKIDKWLALYKELNKLEFFLEPYLVYGIYDRTTTKKNVNQRLREYQAKAAVFNKLGKEVGRFESAKRAVKGWGERLLFDLSNINRDWYISMINHAIGIDGINETSYSISGRDMARHEAMPKLVDSALKTLRADFKKIAPKGLTEMKIPPANKIILQSEVGDKQFSATNARKGYQGHKRKLKGSYRGQSVYKASMRRKSISSTVGDESYLIIGDKYAIDIGEISMQAGRNLIKLFPSGGYAGALNVSQWKDLLDWTFKNKRQLIAGNIWMDIKK